MNIVNLLSLAEAVMKVFETRIEYTEDSFAELTEQQYAAWQQQERPIDGKLYRVLPHEPTFTLQRQLELPVVTERQKHELIAATRLIVAYCEGAAESVGCFEDRLNYAARKMPRVLLPESQK
jgi:hypothetical protein